LNTKEFYARTDAIGTAYAIGNIGRVRAASTQGNSPDEDSGHDRGSITHRALRNVGAKGRIYVKDYMWFVGGRHCMYSIWPLQGFSTSPNFANML
jgi:hypothetical protein